MTEKKYRLILASSSPRRLEILKNLGLEPDEIKPADIDETPKKNEKPHEYVSRVSKEKCKKIYKHHGNKDSFIIAADTIATVGTRIIGKAKNKEDAANIIKLLSGRRHRVYTSISIASPEGKIQEKRILTYVKFKRLSNKEVNDYILTNKWQGKAGAYGLQEDAGGFVISINGSFSSVIGLPAYETKSLLLGMGYK